MWVVIIALIVFGIGTVSLVKWTMKTPTPIKIVASVLFVLTELCAIGWALGEFRN